MVRGYDPVSSDLATLMWDSLFSFWTTDHTIGLSQSEKYVKHWLKNSQLTSSIYNQFKSLAIKPTIRLKKRCNNDISQSKISFLSRESQYFPAGTRDDQIIICINEIQNKLHLKQNLDRELTFFYLQNQPTNATLTFEEQEQELMRNLYKSCYSGYKNYMLSESATKQMAVTCSKYLFFRKSKIDFPIDRKFRYTSQLADQLLI